MPINSSRAGKRITIVGIVAIVIVIMLIINIVIIIIIIIIIVLMIIDVVVVTFTITKVNTTRALCCLLTIAQNNLQGSAAGC